MSPRQILLAVAGLFVVVGVVLCMRTINIDNISCGSVFSPSTTDAKLADNGEEIAGTLEGATPDTDTTNNVDACHSAVSDAKPLAYGGLGLGVVALIAAFVASPNKPVDSDGNPKPSIWR